MQYNHRKNCECCPVSLFIVSSLCFVTLSQNSANIIVSAFSAELLILTEIAVKIIQQSLTRNQMIIFTAVCNNQKIEIFHKIPSGLVLVVLLLHHLGALLLLLLPL